MDKPTRNPILNWLLNHTIAIITALLAAAGSYYSLQSDVKINASAITQNKDDIKQIKVEFLQQSRSNEAAIRELSQRIDTLIFKIADLKTKD